MSIWVNEGGLCVVANGEVEQVSEVKSCDASVRFFKFLFVNGCLHCC
jgi:hypothetical protein